MDAIYVIAENTLSQGTGRNVSSALLASTLSGMQLLDMMRPHVPFAEVSMNSQQLTVLACAHLVLLASTLKQEKSALDAAEGDIWC